MPRTYSQLSTLALLQSISRSSKSARSTALAQRYAGPLLQTDVATAGLATLKRLRSAGRQYQSTERLACRDVRTRDNMQKHVEMNLKIER